MSESRDAVIRYLNLKENFSSQLRKLMDWKWGMDDTERGIVFVFFEVAVTI